jgi:hypothetical protein
MEIFITASIKDTKSIPKSTVAKAEKELPADKEAAALLGELKVIPDGLNAAEYDKRIKKLQPWLEKNKTAKSRPEVEALLKLHTEEQAKVKAGDLKLRGQWITAEENKWNEYNINARKLRAEMEALFKANKPVDAYLVASRIESQYPAATDTPPTIELMKKKLPLVDAALSRAIEEHKRNADQRTQYLGQLTPEKKKVEEEKFKKELADFKLKQGQDKKDKIVAISYYPWDLKSIQDALANLKKEEARLALIDTAAMTLANKKFEQGLKDMHLKSFLSARNNFEIAAKFHSKDLSVKKKVDEAVKAINDAKAKPGAKPITSR